MPFCAFTVLYDLLVARLAHHVGLKRPDVQFQMMTDGQNQQKISNLSCCLLLASSRTPGVVNFLTHFAKFDRVFVHPICSIFATSNLGRAAPRPCARRCQEDR